MRILLVEDNEELAGLTASQLGAAGFSVDLVAGVGDAISVLDTRSYSVVILDLGLPDGDGLKVLRHVRTRRQGVPVLILSARGAMEERVKGLELGADDYLVKPFAFEELKARIAALLRRPGALLGMQLTLANLVFDTEARSASVDGAALRLSAREMQLLELLLRRQDKVVPKASVENELFGLDDEFESNAVEVYVHRLRKRLLDGRAAVTIHTVRGVGYMLAAAS
ncbi:response regulator transcription factor [Pseudoxanthobacter sp.]|uniref:response regulator transcription factor n=1 Tax=Pseudoxanthobacter sp. TaxID=1925742 RepID=UPI002FE032C5